PNITAFQKVAVVKEGSQVNSVLSTITCSDSDGDLTATYVKSVSPSTLCGKCFEVLNCLPNECLQYRAGVGTLDYSTASSYLVTVSCEDLVHSDPDATEVIEVKVLPNAPPHFDPDVKFVSLPKDGPTIKAGTVLYQVDGIDPEDDDITYSMNVNPATSAKNYQINPLTGEIKALIDLSKECLSSITFEVTMTDGHSSVGPQVIDMPISNPNVAPTASNLDTTIQIPEDHSLTTAYTMAIIDGNPGDKVTYTTSSTNAAGLAQYKMDGKSLNVDVQQALDYEQASLRQTDVIVQATDGNCPSPPYTLRIKVTDVNEKPVITPSRTNVEVCEGVQEFDPGYTAVDPDTPDTQTWSLSSTMSNTNGRFGINRNTGWLKTLIDYDVDKGAMTSTVTYTVLVTDKGGLSSTATVGVTFLDCNDNAPIFDQQQAYTYAATECTAAGAKLGTITATDRDSSREQNNVIYYEGSGGSVKVGTGGEVVVVQALPAGSVVTFNAYAYDRGQTPGPLRSVNPAVISVRFTPCPTTPPPVTAAPVVTVTTTTTTTTTAAPLVTKSVDNLWWIILAALLGAAMLGLLSYMLWKYGSLCLHGCKKLNCRQCKARPKPRVVTPKVERRPPLQKAPPPPQEPEEPEAPGPGFLFGFWKERYPNDDFKQMPDRKRLPTPGDMDDHYPHTLDPVDDPLQPQHEALVEPPKKKCIIM
ncbi:cadherin EGF LAG seven-pass G-type receptor 1, partial [Biomphalaria pfeifferi]